MPRLSSVQNETREQVLRLASAGLPTEELGDRLLQMLQVAVPSDTQRLHGVDPGTRLFNRTLAASASDDAVRAYYFQNVYLHGGPLGYLDFPALMRAGLAVVNIHDRPETSLGVPNHLGNHLSPDVHYRAYHELDSPAGGLLRSCYRVHGRWLAAMDLTRMDKKSSFRPAEVTFMQILAPTIGSILGAAMRRERCLVDVTGHATTTSGVLVLGPDHGVRYSTPAGEAWCELLRKSERSGHGLFPTAVWSALARLKGGAQAEVAGSITVPTPSGLVTVEASPGGEDGSVAVVFAPQRIAPPAEIPNGWPLSGREREVVELVIDGLGNREIATRLFVTENTVESHLRHVYEKLGLHSRSQLLASFFREVYWPAMDNAAKTRSGKIMRRVLKAKELGLDTGDLSTLEE